MVMTAAASVARVFMNIFFSLPTRLSSRSRMLPIVSSRGPVYWPLGGGLEGPRAPTKLLVSIGGGRTNAEAGDPCPPPGAAVCTTVFPLLPALPSSPLLLLLLLKLVPSTSMPNLGGGDGGTGRRAASGRDFGPAETPPASPPAAEPASPNVLAITVAALSPSRSAAAVAEVAWVGGAGREALSDVRRAAADCDRVGRRPDGCSIFVITSVLAKLTA